MLVNIITYLSDVSNAPDIHNSIIAGIKEFSILIKWYIITESQIEFSQHPQIEIICLNRSDKHKAVNHLLNNIHEGYIYFLDENNILHPDLLTTLCENRFECKGLVFNQILEDNTERQVRDEITKTLKIKPGAINQSQYILHKELIGETRWHLDIDTADGHFIAEVYNKNRDAIKVLSKTLAFHNKLTEKKLLQAAPKTLGKGSIVIPNREYYQKELKYNLNPVLRGTITLLSRLCGKKLKIVSINENVVNVIPLRKASPFYKGGKGVLLIFENSDQIEGIFKPLIWQD